MTYGWLSGADIYCNQKHAVIPIAARCHIDLSGVDVNVEATRVEPFACWFQLCLKAVIGIAYTPTVATATPKKTELNLNVGSWSPVPHLAAR